MSTTFDTTLSGDIAVQAQCGLCGGMLRDPRLFECGEHTFCYACLKDTPRSFACPKCLVYGKEVKRTKAVEKLRVDEEALERLKDVQCDECEVRLLEAMCYHCGRSFCGKCVSRHAQCPDNEKTWLEDVRLALVSRVAAESRLSHTRQHAFEQFCAAAGSLVEKFGRDTTSLSQSLDSPELAEIQFVETLARRQLLERGDRLMGSLRNPDRPHSTDTMVVLQRRKKALFEGLQALWETAMEEVQPEEEKEEGRRWHVVRSVGESSTGKRRREAHVMVVDDEEEEEEEEEPPKTPARTYKKKKKPADAEQLTSQTSLTFKNKHEALPLMRQLAEAGPFHLLRVLQFEKVDLRNTASKHLAGALSNMPALERVEFVECHLREQEVKFIRPALKSMAGSLTHLVFKGNEFEDAVAASLIEAARLMPGLRTLAIHARGLGDATEGKLRGVVEEEEFAALETLEVTGFEEEEQVGRVGELVRELLGV